MEMEFVNELKELEHVSVQVTILTIDRFTCTAHPQI